MFCYELIGSSLIQALACASVFAAFGWPLIALLYVFCITLGAVWLTFFCFQWALRYEILARHLCLMGAGMGIVLGVFSALLFCLGVGGAAALSFLVIGGVIGLSLSLISLQCYHAWLCNDEGAKTSRFWKASIWVGIVILMAIFLNCYHAGSLFENEDEVPFRQAESEGVVHAFLAGELHPDANGIVTLPPRWADAAKDGRVYVTSDTRGMTYLLFPTSRWASYFSLAGNFEGVVYCRKPYEFKKALAGAGSWVTLVGPSPAPSETLLHGAWTASRQEAVVSKQVGAHWYSVWTWNDE